MEQAYKEIVEYINNLMHLPQEEVEKLKTIFSYRKLLKNEHFLKAGELLEYVGFNLKGAFRYYYTDYEGNDKTKYFIVENDFILSLSSFIERSPALYSIQALEDSEILMAPVTKIYDLVSSNIYWQTIYRYIIEKTYVFKEKREAEFLLYDAKRRYLNFLNEYSTISHKIKQHYVASYLGVTPESLSRIRSQIQNS